MHKELYFDISSEESGGSLYRMTGGPEEMSFYYNYSQYDENKDELTLFEAHFSDFAGFWAFITRDPEWHYLHPLYVHPEQRNFVREQLQKVNWALYPDKKWQVSHQRQWKKVLTDPSEYYKQVP